MSDDNATDTDAGHAADEGRATRADIERQRSALTEVIRYLSAFHAVDPNTFSKSIDMFIRAMDVDEAFVARQLSATRSTVLRWRTGKTAPSNAQRCTIFESLHCVALQAIQHLNSEVLLLRTKDT